MAHLFGNQTRRGGAPRKRQSQNRFLELRVSHPPFSKRINSKSLCRPKAVPPPHLPHGVRSLTTCSTPATAESAVARSHFCVSRNALPGWMRLRKSFASLDWIAFSLLIMPISLVTSMYSCRCQFSSGPLAWFPASAPLVRRAVTALVTSVGNLCCRAQRSKASITDPASTVVAFHSPFDRARLTAPMSFLRLDLRSGSEMNESSDVEGAGDSSGHRAKAWQITVTGWRPRKITPTLSWMLGFC